jgi:hypothetical protein
VLGILAVHLLKDEVIEVRAELGVRIEEVIPFLLTLPNLNRIQPALHAESVVNVGRVEVPDGLRGHLMVHPLVALATQDNNIIMLQETSLSCGSIVPWEGSLEYVIVWGCCVLFRPMIHVDSCDLIDFIEMNGDEIPTSPSLQVSRNHVIHKVTVSACIMGQPCFKEEQTVSLNAESKERSLASRIISHIFVG